MMVRTETIVQRSETPVERASGKRSGADRTLCEHWVTNCRRHADFTVIYILL